MTPYFLILAACILALIYGPPPLKVIGFLVGAYAGMMILNMIDHGESKDKDRH